MLGKLNETHKMLFAGGQEGMYQKFRNQSMEVWSTIQKAGESGVGRKDSPGFSTGSDTQTDRRIKDSIKDEKM